MKRAGPLLQMTLALVVMCGTLVLLANLFFRVLPNPDAQTLHLRMSIAEALAVQVAALMPSEGAIEGRRLATRELALALAQLEQPTPPGRAMRRAGKP